MTPAQQTNLDALLNLAEDDNSPMTSWEVDFVQSLDQNRDRELNDKQLDVFDRLERQYLNGQDN